MYKIKIYTIGKIKEAYLDAGLSEYHKRLKATMSIEWILVKDNAQLEKSLQNTPFIALDPRGEPMSSEDFSSYLFSALENHGSRLHLVIGGAEGLTSDLHSQALHLISLSPMTFTHQMTRLILLEQIYRAAEIKKGSTYHK